VVLSERFFREATEATVPLDLRVLRALRSPFEIDIYVWLTWRLFRLRKPVTIPWDSLQLQFGCGYKNLRHFKRRFLRYLRNVIGYYPERRGSRPRPGLRHLHVPPAASPAPRRDRHAGCRDSPVTLRVRGARVEPEVVGIRS
jgi:hypothetical protein